MDNPEFPSASPEDRIMQDGWPQVRADQVDREAVAGQVEFVAAPFSRHPGGNKNIPTKQKRVRVIASYDPKEGTTVYTPIRETPVSVTPGELPQYPYG